MSDLTIYQQMQNVLKPNEIANHESDLYCKVTKESRKIVANYKYLHLVTTFRDIQTNQLWYDIPFAYDPWWYAQGAKRVA